MWTETVPETLTPAVDEIERALTEMREHGGEYVGLDAGDSPLVYASTLDELKEKLGTMGLQLTDVIVSKVPEYGMSYL